MRRLEVPEGRESIVRLALQHPDKVCYLVLAIIVLHLLGVIPDMKIMTWGVPVPAAVAAEKGNR